MVDALQREGLIVAKETVREGRRPERTVVDREATGREALGAQVDWSLVATRAGWLLALAVFCAWFATRAFRTYQRSA